MRSRSSFLVLLGALLLALVGGWGADSISRAACAVATASASQKDPPSESPLSASSESGSSESGIDDDESGDGSDAAHVVAHALPDHVMAEAAAWFTSSASSYVGFVSEPSTPPPRG